MAEVNVSGNWTDGLHDVVTWRRDAYAVLVPFIASLCLVALLANFTVVCAVPWRKGLVTPTLRLTVSLALADIYTSLWVLFSLFYNSYLYYVLGVSTNVCVALSVEMVRTGGMLTGTLHLLALAVNHYLSIARPFVYRKLLTPTATISIVLFSWLFPPATLFIYAASKSGEGYRSPGCTDVGMFNAMAYRAAVCGILTALFVATCLLYLHILLILRRMRSGNAALALSGGNSSLRRERRMMVTTMLILATFLVGWAPASFHFVASAEGGLLRRGVGLYTLMVISAIQLAFIMLKSIVNPIIYAVRIPEIKERLSSLVGLVEKRRASTAAAKTLDKSKSTASRWNNNTLENIDEEVEEKTPLQEHLIPSDLTSSSV